MVLRTSGFSLSSSPARTISVSAGHGSVLLLTSILSRSSSVPPVGRQCGGSGFGGLSNGFSMASSDGLPPSFNPSPSSSRLSWGSDPPWPSEVELPMRVRGDGCAEVSNSQSVGFCQFSLWTVRSLT